MTLCLGFHIPHTSGYGSRYGILTRSMERAAPDRRRLHCRPIRSSAMPPPTRPRQAIPAATSKASSPTSPCPHTAEQCVRQTTPRTCASMDYAVSVDYGVVRRSGGGDSGDAARRLLDRARVAIWGRVGRSRDGQCCAGAAKAAWTTKSRRS